MTVGDQIASPPTKIKETIEKTVEYVKKNGQSFEQRLISSNDREKFSFLDPDDQHHAYYKWKLNGIIEQKVQGSTQLATEEIVGKPRELKFLTKLPPISSLDQDIIKLTALFVAQNGADYMKAVYEHERKKGNKSQFDFLNQSHSLHLLFETYVNQYTALIKYHQNVEDDVDVIAIKEKLSTSQNILEIANKRAQYSRQHKDKLRTEIKEKHDKQLHYASIDWQDFSLVGNIKFDAIDEVTELAVPLARDDLVYRALQSRTEELDFKVERPDIETKHLDETEQKEASETETRVAEPKFKGMKIKAAGESRLKKSKLKSKSPSGMIRCPITNQLIPEEKFDSHLKILLRDPRYKEQQDNFMRKNFTYETNLTTEHVYENIKRLARKRAADDDVEPAKKVDIGPSQ